MKNLIHPSGQMTAALEACQDRREFLATAAMGIASAGAASLLSVHPASAARGEEVRPFHVDISKDALLDLRERLKATRWPDREIVADESQGVRLKTVQQLVLYWRTDYDWRKMEARLNALPQFVTEIDGVEVDKGGHFAAWEQPKLFSAEMRAAFRSLRQSI